MKNQKKFIIKGEICPTDNEQLYWSNVDGWVDKASATIFNESERVTMSPPEGWTDLEYILD